MSSCWRYSPGKKTFVKPRVSPYPVGLGVGGGVPQGVNLVVDAYWDTAQETTGCCWFNLLIPMVEKEYLKPRTR